MANTGRDDQRQFARQNQLLLKIERPFAREVAKEKNRYIRAQSEEYARTVALSDDLLTEHQQHLNIIFRKYYARTIRVFIGDTERNLPEEKNSINPMLETKADMFSLIFGEWLSTEGGRKVRSTAETTQKDIKRVIATALAASEPTSVVVKRILTARGVSSSRAATIARTETHNAATFASRRTAETISARSGLEVLKKWIPALDERTRSSHAAMTRHQAISLDAEFLVNGARMDRPGDPAGGARNVINCRCVLVYKRKKT